MPEDTWRPNWKLPTDLQGRAHILRVKLGYSSVQDWAIDVLTAAADAQEAELADAERKRRSR